MSQPESRLSKDIRDAMTARGAFVFKVHGGPTMMAGLPDLIACVPSCSCARLCNHRNRRGLFVGLETKMPGNKPTIRQAYVHDQIRSSAGLIVVPHSVTEAISAVWGTRTPPGPC